MTHNSGAPSGPKLKSLLEKIPFYSPVKSFIWRQLNIAHNKTPINMVTSFPLYVPLSAGNYNDLSSLTIQSIKQTIPFLAHFVKTVRQEKLTLTLARDFPLDRSEIEAAENLKILFDKYGSDKANHHDYHFIYGPILKEISKITGILEIGLGTNNTDVASNMGLDGKPGASLRAFQEFLPDALIYGADIDTRILFEEERIQTFYVDQTNLDTLDSLSRQIPDNLDLIIDDGLHSPNANIAVLAFALDKLKSKGWVVVEDIVESALPVWEVVAGLLPNGYSPFLFKASNKAFVFAVQKN